MINYASFSPLKISVGKLLAGRYEIVRSLRSDEFSFELLALDKAAEDLPVALRLLPGLEAGRTAGSVVVDTAEGGFCFSVEPFTSAYFEQPEEEAADDAAGPSVLSRPAHLSASLNALVQSGTHPRSWLTVRSAVVAVDSSRQRKSAAAGKARRKKARIKKLKIIMRASLKPAAGLTLLFAALLLSLSFGHTAAAARRSGPIQAADQQENQSALAPAAESPPQH